MALINTRTKTGKQISYEPEKFSSGGMKDAHWGHDKTYVVLFYRDRPGPEGMQRLDKIVSTYKESIFDGAGGKYWESLFNWPTDIVDHDGRVGIVAPVYNKHFFFQHGSKNNDMLGIRGREKEGKWFASASHRASYLDPRELGDWRSYFRLCILISRAVKRLHSSGLAHSDLSYKNVLIDPSGGHAMIIDIDSLVVPGVFPPDVVGTPDFIAPEVMATKHLSLDNKDRSVPSINTDKHALAVLIYMYLLYRHPLRGRKIHDEDAVKDEEYAMGERALFVEHPTDTSNRVDPNDVRTTALPWADPAQLPYTVTGPYLTKLFDRAFVEDLAHPHRRPSADEWNTALVKTLDLMQPCMNPKCAQKWFVFDNSLKPSCPFCKTPYTKQLPVLDLYSARQEGKYRPDGHRIMVYDKQYFYKWHMSRNYFPGAKLADADKRPVGYFVFHQGKWLLVNQAMPDLKDITNDKAIPIGEAVELVSGGQILFSKQSGGRMAAVQIVN